MEAKDGPAMKAVLTAAGIGSNAEAGGSDAAEDLRLVPVYGVICKKVAAPGA
jgi:hypothetical protein